MILAVRSLDPYRDPELAKQRHPEKRRGRGKTRTSLGTTKGDSDGADAWK